MTERQRVMPVFASSPAGGSDFSNYSDRICPPEETIRRVWPHLDALGITRVGRQTGLDRTGIPTWAAFRPNSKTLAGSQGKGLTDAAACASAVMEAAEVAVAETPRGEKLRASAESLSARDERWFDPGKFLDRPFDPQQAIWWIEGQDLMTPSRIWVPADVVDMDGERSELSGICKTTNGLASGNSFDEAVFHALCELVERDGTSLWSLLNDDQALKTAFDPAEFADPMIDAMLAEIATAGMRVTLFDHTSDIGIPVVMAVLGPADARWASSLEIAAGYGAHPVSLRAAIRAITEAAQSRVTSIAASRDDIGAELFDEPADDINVRMLMTPPVAKPPEGLSVGRPLRALVDWTLERLQTQAIDVCAVEISDDGLPFSVVKVVSQALEDRDANLNWSPGVRCGRVMQQ